MREAQRPQAPAKRNRARDASDYNIELFFVLCVVGDNTMFRSSHRCLLLYTRIYRPIYADSSGVCTKFGIHEESSMAPCIQIRWLARPVILPTIQAERTLVGESQTTDTSRDTDISAAITAILNNTRVSGSVWVPQRW